MHETQEQIAKDIPILKVYAAHVASHLLNIGHHYEDGESLRNFLAKYITDSMERTYFMYNVLWDTTLWPQALTYKSILKVLLQKQVGHIYAVEIGQFEDQDTSPRELIGEWEPVDGCIKFEIRNKNLLD